MKNSKLLAVFLSLFVCNVYAATDAEIAGAVFTNQEFTSKMGQDSLRTIKIEETTENVYQLVVNSRAPLVDGCSYSATVTARYEKYAISPLSTGIRTVLKVSDVASVCGGFQ